MSTEPIHFIGAGPGSPDLLTLRGRDLIAAADLRVRHFPSLEEPFHDIIPDKPVLPQVECRNEWHH